MLVELLGAWLMGPIDPANPIVTAKNIVVPRGNTVTVRVWLVNEQRMPVRTAGATLTINIGLPGRCPLRTISFTANPKIGPNVYDAVLQSTDTMLLRGLLTYDVWATIGTTTQQVVSTSYWNSALTA